MANFSKRTWEKIASCLTNTLGNKAASKNLINNIKKDGIAWEQLAKDLD